MTTADQIIEEIRESRCQMSRECGHDVRRYIAQLQALNTRYQKQVEAYRHAHPDIAAKPEESDRLAVAR